LVRRTPSTTGGGFSVTFGSVRMPDPGAFVAAADDTRAGLTRRAREGEARTWRDEAALTAVGVPVSVRCALAASADAGVLPPDVARIAATPPDNASAVTAARTPLRRLRNIVLMTVPDRL